MKKNIEKYLTFEFLSREDALNIGKRGESIGIINDSYYRINGTRGVKRDSQEFRKMRIEGEWLLRKRGYLVPGTRCIYYGGEKIDVQDPKESSLTSDEYQTLIRLSKIYQRKTRKKS